MTADAIIWLGILGGFFGILCVLAALADALERFTHMEHGDHEQ